MDFIVVNNTATCVMGDDWHSTLCAMRSHVAHTHTLFTKSKKTLFFRKIFTQFPVYSNRFQFNINNSNVIYHEKPIK